MAHPPTELIEELIAEIGQLQAANASSNDPGVERRLVELRLAAAQSAPPSDAAPPSWWADVDDPFASVAGVPPEITRAELTPRILRGAIAHHGCLMVRGLVSPEHVTRLTRDIDETLAAFDRCVENGRPSEAPWFVPFDPPNSGDLPISRALSRRFAGAVNAADSPRTFYDLVAAFEDAGVPNLLREYLGGQPCVAIDKCTVRRVPADAATGWHQDSYRFPQGAPVCDVWVAFSHCGGNAPGLEIVPRRVEESAALDPSAAIPWVVSPDVVQRIAADTATLSPRFEPGDAILFDEMLLHRTGTFPGMSEPRYGADAWFFPAGTYLADKMPAVVI